MTKSQEQAEQFLINEFVKDLEATTEQVQKLLDEIYDSKVDFVALKTELKFLVENVKELSAIVRNENGAGSVLTRLALIEKSVEDIKLQVEKSTQGEGALAIRISILEQKIEILMNFVSKQKINILSPKEEIEIKAEKSEKWKLYTAIATGILALLGTLAAFII